jgi:ribosome-binding protein aMBF1 (putative translation factor)
MSYEEYLREVIKQTGASLKTLAQELQIDEEELERLARG